MYTIPHSESSHLSWFIEETIAQARLATCTDARCGSVVVKDNMIIGRGFNSPPNDREGSRRCHLHKSDYDIRVTDKTCCIHAEQRAIMDTLRNHPEMLPGSRLYFIRVDSEGNRKFAKGEPYCTICSKMTLDAGIGEFVLYREEGICIYDTEEYNSLSYHYKSPNE